MSDLALPDDWEPVSLLASRELVQAWEFSAGHGQRGVALVGQAIARRYRRDDVLFRLTDGRVAQVHITRSAETNPRWPDAQIFTTLEEWRAAWAEDQAGYE